MPSAGSVAGVGMRYKKTEAESGARGPAPSAMTNALYYLDVTVDLPLAVKVRQALEGESRQANGSCVPAPFISLLI